jgi:hypothetical protein
MRALLTIVICVLWATAGQAQTRVTVYLIASPPNVVDLEGFRACQEATEDLRKALAGKKRITVVGSLKQARVSVSVFSSRTEARSNFRPSDLTDVNAETVHAVRALLSVEGSGYSIGLLGVTDGSTKRRAAAKLADQIDRWVKDNEEYLR